MPLPLQAKLLRAIETRTIQRVGGKGEIKLDLDLFVQHIKISKRKLMKVSLELIYFIELMCFQLKFLH